MEIDLKAAYGLSDHCENFGQKHMVTNKTGQT